MMDDVPGPVPPCLYLYRCEAVHAIHLAHLARPSTTTTPPLPKTLQSRYLSGVGVAKQRKAIMDGLRESVRDFAGNVPGTSAKEVLDLLMITNCKEPIDRRGLARLLDPSIINQAHL